MSREVAVVEKISETEAVSKVEKTIEASPRRKRAVQDEAEVEAETQDEAA
jgi:CarD family transcriptional regulator